jgi:alcohol dehydrogenase class IV
VSPPSAYRNQQGLRAVISGVGCVRERLAEELDVLSIRRPLIVCGANLARSPVLEVVRRALGRPVVVFDGSRPHTPVETVDRGAAEARAARADGLIAVGGSSAVDCAKGVAVLVASGRESVAELTPIHFERLFEEPRETHPRFPLLAVTTTLSFAEFLPFWAVRRGDLLRKLPYSDLECVERTVFLDGELAAHTPQDVWFETGVKALDDALSAYCRSAAPEPFLDPVLTDAIGQLVEWLPASGTGGPASLRQQVLTACWMTKFTLPRLGAFAVPAWFSTTARHSLGAVCAVPHGAASCVALPHALRYHAAATRSRQAALASALGWKTSDEVPLERAVDELLDRLRTPRRLRDLGIDRKALAEVVSAMLSESPKLGSEEALLRACEEMF